MSEPFLSRWSKRKQALAHGLPADEPAPDVPAQATAHSLAPQPGTPPQSALRVACAPVSESSAAPNTMPNTAPKTAPNTALSGTDLNTPPGVSAGAAQAQASDRAPPPELPTLEDARALTPTSNFQPFMRQGVASDVRNAALKKLFTDPHFNVMDGLDIYIGDYNTPDPLPAGMLQKMVGAQFLNLFPKPSETTDSDPATHAGLAPSDGSKPADPAQAQPPVKPEQSPVLPQSPPNVAQSPPLIPPPDLPQDLFSTSPRQAPAQLHNDHPDLQLQPNHAPASPSPGPSTG
ncbi:DUF3306 domain-containing protein [Limnohabitans sp.]|jgi:hypothetical protein|uniref:DUF3306 domain-containing protein n=1 Tax=Limnohabitans sp. TaxID=1907725 RepID=UPI0037BF3BBC